MRLEELNIGDWVAELGSDEPAKVVGISTRVEDGVVLGTVELVNDYGSFVVVEHDGEWPLRVAGALCGIGVDPQILELNGFVELDDGLWQNDERLCGVDDQSGSMEFYTFPGDPESDEIIYNKIRCCREVHRLQQAMRLSGLGDMAEKFKLF